MKKETYILIWLIANLLLISVSLLMPWLFVGFEPTLGSMPILGLEFIFIRIINSVELWIELGFAWLWVLSFLQGVGGIFVICYAVFKMINIAKPKVHTGSKVLSVALLVVIVIFLIRNFASGPITLPSFGYWVFTLGVLSSASYEWRNSAINNAAVIER